jgi:hypothetical protein
MMDWVEAGKTDADFAHLLSVLDSLEPGVNVKVAIVDNVCCFRAIIVMLLLLFFRMVKRCMTG